MKYIIISLFIAFNFFAFAKGKGSRRTLTLEWEAIEGVSKYEIEVFKIVPGEEPHKLKSFYRKTSSWKARLKPGNYKFRLRAYDMREVPGEWGDFNDLNVAYPTVKKLTPPKDMVITPDQKGQIDVEFKWVPLNDIKEYELKIYNLSQKKLIKKTVTTNSITVPMLIGQNYSWDVVTGKEESQTEKFPFTISGTVLPKVKYLKEQTLADGQNVHWSSPPQAQFADIKIYALRLDLLNKRDPYNEVFVKEIKDLKDSKYNVAQHLLGGLYKISISTRANLWQGSSSSEIYFAIKAGKIIKMDEVSENIQF